jgi:very-short-patch-repair endonuclease
VRTAFDLGRRGSLDEAVARLDALGNATAFKADDVVALSTRHRGARGLHKLSAALEMYDLGAESPRETRLRLLLIRAGFPRPRTQIPVVAASGKRYRLDMGWEDVMIAAEYDGEHHRLDRPQFVNDIIRSKDVHELGWLVVRVVAGSSDADVIERMHRAWNSRLR